MKSHSYCHNSLNFSFYINPLIQHIAVFLWIIFNFILLNSTFVTDLIKTTKLIYPILVASCFCSFFFLTFPHFSNDIYFLMKWFLTALFLWSIHCFSLWIELIYLFPSESTRTLMLNMKLEQKNDCLLNKYQCVSYILAELPCRESE
jgi:hypothetical protein